MADVKSKVCNVNDLQLYSNWDLRSYIMKNVV